MKPDLSGIKRWALEEGCAVTSDVAGDMVLYVDHQSALEAAHEAGRRAGLELAKAKCEKRRGYFHSGDTPWEAMDEAIWIMDDLLEQKS